MKIAFFGTPDFVCEFLDTLNTHNLKPELIVTGKDVPVGRKMVLTSPLPKKWAETHTTKILQPDKINEEIIEFLKKESWDIFVVIAYGKILPEALIQLPRFGTINVHYSLLPKYRGATPVESAILNGDTHTGVCIQHMEYELDAGAILCEQKIEIKENENHEEVRSRLNTLAQNMLIDVLENIEEKIKNKTKQDHQAKTICKKIKKSDGLIDLSENDEILFRKYKAYYGWPGIFFFKEKNGITQRIKITDAIYENKKFIIKKVIPEGKKEIDYLVFLSQ